MSRRPGRITDDVGSDPCFPDVSAGTQPHCIDSKALGAPLDDGLPARILRGRAGAVQRRVEVNFSGSIALTAAIR